MSNGSRYYSTDMHLLAAKSNKFSLRSLPKMSFPHGKMPSAVEEKVEANLVRAHPAVSYTAGRFVLMAAVAALLFAVGFRSWLLVLLAIAISMPLSWFVLRTQRERLAERVAAHQQRRRDEREELRAALDQQEQGDL